MLILHSVKIYFSFGRSLRSTRGQGMAADANVSTFTHENIALWSSVQKRIPYTIKTKNMLQVTETT